MVSLKVQIIIQRFHPTLVGGAEYHSRLLANALKFRGFDVTVLTTTSKDHMKWDDTYPEGEEVIGGIKVKRFRPELPRFPLLLKVIKLFIKLGKILELPEWAQSRLSGAFTLLQGPYIPELSKFLKEQNGQLVIFYSYLYYPAVECSKATRHFILIPTAHDEFPLYLQGVENLVKRATLILLQTNSEKELIERTFSEHGELKVGAFGFDSPDQLNWTKVSHQVPDHDSYFFFAGRIGRGKKVHELIDYLSKINRARAKPYKLYLAGSLESDYQVPSEPWIIYLGFISDEQKFNYIAGALAVINPSSMESLSILALEALMAGRPLIVNQKCEVLKEYASWSPLCLTFHDLESLAGAIVTASALLRSADFRELGDRTKSEVLSRFSWDNTVNIISDFAVKHKLGLENTKGSK